MKLKDLTILLSAAGSPSMPGALACYRSNGERNIRVIGMDMADDPSAKYMVDVFYKVPPATAANYCDIVLDICKREKVDVYIPTISAEVSAVSARLDEFEALGVKVSVSNMESVEISIISFIHIKPLKRQESQFQNITEFIPWMSLLKAVSIWGIQKSRSALRLSMAVVAVEYVSLMLINPDMRFMRMKSPTVSILLMRICSLF